MNDDTLAGKFDKVAGKIKESVGEAFGNEKLANSGAADQVKGSAKETWGNVKDTASDLHDNAQTHTSTTTSSLHDDAHTTGHDTRRSVTSTAEDIKDGIRNKLDDLKR